MRFQTFPFLLFAISVSAELHHLFVGPLTSTNFLYTLEFDDEALTLKVIKNHTTHAAHSFITFDNEKKKNLYGASVGDGLDFASYDVKGHSQLSLSSVVSLGGNCTTSNTVFLQPHTSSRVLYGQAWPATCGTVYDMNPSGSIGGIIQNFTYAPESALHGAALSADGRYLYSADLRGDSVWRHRILVDGRVPENGDGVLRKRVTGGPRHILVKDGWIYTLLETTSEVAGLKLASDGDDLVEMGRWKVYATGNETDYRGNTLALSASGKYLWASTRSGFNVSNTPGYISAFSLSDTGEVERRAVSFPTTTFDSRGNGVSPSHFSDRWVAYADYGTGYVQVWKFDDTKEGSETAEMAAEVLIRDGGCCSNVIWYD